MKTFIIAEIAQAHNGDFNEAINYIKALATTGVTAVKFQTHIAEAESSVYEPFRVPMAGNDKTRFDYWKRMEFTLAQWNVLKQLCDDLNLEFLSSPFSNAAVDLLEQVGVQRYKVGSGEVSNFVLLEKLASTKKPIIISSGMSSFDELDKTVAFLKQRNIPFSILQCTTSYPTLPSQWGLNVITQLKERYHVPVGFSDHSSGIEACLAAVMLGAEIIECHVVFDKNSLGPDATSSLTMPEITQLVQSVRNIEKALQHPIDKTDNSAFTDVKQIFEKSLAINKTLLKGHILTFDDLETKKPKGFGINASEFEKVIGKQLTRDMEQWEFLNEQDVSSTSSD